MNVVTFKVLNNASELSDKEIAEEILRIESVMNSNSKLRFHLLLGDEEELGRAINIIARYIKSVFK